MKERPESINDENVLKVDVMVIAQDRRFTNLKFENAQKKLPQIQKWLLEAEELRARDLLIEKDLNIIKEFTNQLTQHLESLLTFEIRTTNSTAHNEHNLLEDRVNTFYNSVYQQLPMRILPFLRQEAARSSQDKQALAEEQKAASQARKQAEDILIQLQQKLEELDERANQLESTSGKVGAKALGIYFQKETALYQSEASRWFGAACFAYGILLLCLFVIVPYYIKNYMSGVLTWQESVVKLALFAVLWYALSFIIKNYNVSSHLAAVNRHRAAVAQTLEDFLASNPDLKGEMLQNGTDAMFKHVAIGFITKAEKDSGNPLLEIVNKIINPKSE